MIVCNKSKIILNTAVKNQTYKETLQIRNILGEKIHVTPWSSCGCTQAVPQKGLLLPGESCELYMSYTPGASGLDEKQFGVNFDAQGNSYKLVVTIIAKVI